MSGTHPTPAEQHLGDRLAALVDGELGHDARERVLAHLATCARCKAEADAQRRLKSVFAQAAPPPPSEGFLARLQGLPGMPPGSPGAEGEGGDPGGFGTGPGSGPPGGGGLGGERITGGTFGVRPGGGFGYVPAADGGHPSVLPGGSARTGFRIHEVGRAEGGRGDDGRSAWRGRRFAFAAASAVSFAAIALGGAMPTVTAGDFRGDGSGSNVTPVRSAGGQAAATGSADSLRRRGGTGTAGTGSAVTTTAGASAAASAGLGRLAGVERGGAAPPPFLHATTPLTGGFALRSVPPAGQLNPLGPLRRPAGTVPGPYASAPVAGTASVAATP
ncbi:zf-HC2 domain-containing protein [Streptomyces sp. MUM 203J]|uniref:anti-sigma factor family protein n=1 Tax=Streptomyces sp. MUM 203J TaxID=2791990 RepID=UPI001F0456A4|nr:anti-sigma factor [Streptomyces sp. MUM 203J]MCH0540067.1 zf-HC2 domain-containing protein [Streptomyces sp. MUM 203J]